MKDYAYMRTKPKNIKWSLKYSDNSGDRILISIGEKCLDVLIKQGEDVILLPVEDIEWLRQVLDEAKDISKLPNSEQEPERSVATKPLKDQNDG